MKKNIFLPSHGYGRAVYQGGYNNYEPIFDIYSLDFFNSIFYTLSPRNFEVIFWKKYAARRFGMGPRTISWIWLSSVSRGLQKTRANFWDLLSRAAFQGFLHTLSPKNFEVIFWKKYFFKPSHGYGWAVYQGATTTTSPFFRFTL